MLVPEFIYGFDFRKLAIIVLKLGPIVSYNLSHLLLVLRIGIANATVKHFQRMVNYNEVVKWVYGDGLGPGPALKAHVCPLSKYALPARPIAKS